MEALPFDSLDRLVLAAAALRERMKGVLLPAGLAAEVREALAGMEPGAYSVRSSSTLEDLAGAAFAGQHDTYLNCVGAEEILDRIRACFISLWQDRAVTYKHSKSPSTPVWRSQSAATASALRSCIPCGLRFLFFRLLCRSSHYLYFHFHFRSGFFCFRD